MTDDPDDATREFVARLFRLDEEPDEPAAPITTGNVVPKEGTNPPPPQADEMRDFTRQLFRDVNPGDHVRN